MINWGWIIGFLYGTVANLYNFMMNLVLNSEFGSLKNIVSSIYSMVGIFMLFRIAISLLQYLINPDKVSDKSVGGGKLVVRIVVAIVLLLSLDSFVFDWLNQIQTAILKSDLITKIFKNNGTAGGNNFGDLSSYSLNNSDESTLIDNVYAVDNTYPNDKSDDVCIAINVSSDAYKSRDPLPDHPNVGFGIDFLINDLKGCSIDIAEKKLDEYLINETRYFWHQKGPDNNQFSYEVVEDPSISGYSGDKFVGVSFNYMYNDAPLAWCSDNFFGLTKVGHPLNGSSLDLLMLAYQGNSYYENGITKTCELVNNNFCTKLDDNSYNCIPLKFTVRKSVSNEERKDFSCYYFYRGVNDPEDEDVGYSGSIDLYTNDEYSFDKNNMRYRTCIDDLKNSVKIYKVNFKYMDEKSDSNGWYSIDNTDYKYQMANGSWINLGKAKEYNNAANTIDNGKCPSIIDWATCNDENCYPVSGTGGNNGSIVFSNENKNVSSFVFGSSYENTVRDDAVEWLTGYVCPYDPDYGGSGDVGVTDDMYECKKSEDGGWTTGNSFANILVRSFIKERDCTGECKENLNCYTFDSKTNEAVGNYTNQNKIDFDVLSSFIGGLVAIVFMALLIIEIFIRSMKLLLLRVISPVAVISYINPNDKIFSQWVKMYAATYADLFLKLIGIQAGFAFAAAIIEAGINGNRLTGIAAFACYMAAFIFAKTVPNMISKIFGIDVAGGTFKDSFGMLKAGAGLAAGAAIGGTVGAITGMGSGGSLGTVAGGLFAGAARGAMGGAKGNIINGASTQASRNRVAKDANLNGSSSLKRFGARFVDPTRKFDNEIASAKSNLRVPEQESTVLDAAASDISAMEKRAADKIAEGKGAEITEVQNYHKAEAELANFAPTMTKEEYLKAHPITLSADGSKEIPHDQAYKAYQDDQNEKRATLSGKVLSAKQEAEHAYITNALGHDNGDAVIRQLRDSLINKMDVHSEVFKDIKTDFQDYDALGKAKGEIGSRKSKVNNDVYKRKEEISQLEHEREMANVTKQAVGKGGK